MNTPGRKRERVGDRRTVNGFLTQQTRGGFALYSVGLQILAVWIVPRFRNRWALEMNGLVSGGLAYKSSTEAWFRSQRIPTYYRTKGGDISSPVSFKRERSLSGILLSSDPSPLKNSKRSIPAIQDGLSLLSLPV